MSYRETGSPCPPDPHALPEQHCVSDCLSCIPTLWLMGTLGGKEGECRVLQVSAWGPAPALFSTSLGSRDWPRGADPPRGWQRPGMGNCGCVGPWQGEGASLQLASQKELSLSSLPSPGKACPWGRGNCSSKQTDLRSCNTCPSSPQSLLHRSLSHRHLIPATNLSLGRAHLIQAVTCCCNPLSPFFLSTGWSQSPSWQWDMELQRGYFCCTALKQLGSVKASAQAYKRT